MRDWDICQSLADAHSQRTVRTVVTAHQEMIRLAAAVQKSVYIRTA
jgi:hypothetical protein